MACQRHHGLKGFECLERRFEADAAWLDLGSCSCLSHHSSNQVVRQGVSPDLLSYEFWGLATKAFHLHDRLDAPQIQFDFPVTMRPLCTVYLGNRLF